MYYPLKSQLQLQNSRFGKLCDSFFEYPVKKDVILHVNPLTVDTSHGIPMLIKLQSM